MLTVYLGYDSKEQAAYSAARDSLLRRASAEVRVIPLVCSRLQAQGLLTRPFDRRGGIYDFVSNAPCATEFAITRFFVPHLAQTGFAVFADCDMIFLADVAELFALADPTKAVQVVKHQHIPTAGTKMDGRVQTAYGRKNWSSLMLWNCDHPSNLRLSLHDLNHRRGLELHQFYWLDDNEIGELPGAWNWLVGEQPKPDDLKVAHFTNGGPFTEGWLGREHDELWLREAQSHGC